MGAQVSGEDFLRRLEAFDGYPAEGQGVFDLCSEVRTKAKKFLATGIVTKIAWLEHLGVETEAFDTFMKMRPVGCRADADSCFYEQPGAETPTYPKLYHFFEKMRLMQSELKSTKRLANEKVCEFFWREDPMVAYEHAACHGGFILRHDGAECA